MIPAVAATAPVAHASTTTSSDAESGFPDLLRRHRLRAGLTQRALSDLSTVSPRTIRDLESGRANARSLTLRLLADGLRLDGTARDTFVRAGHHRRSAVRLEAVPDEPRPASVDAVLGRDAEICAVIDLLTSGRRRMVSLSGLPGVGKTRVAAEVAARLRERHQWAVLWEDTTLRAFGLPATARIRQTAGRAPTLLVLDGAAYDDCGPAVIGLLAACPELRVITTSHQPWQLAGIQTTVLAPLPTPAPASDPTELIELASVRLLADRLTEIRAGYTLTAADAAATAELCRRLDGLPLALEAVAGRARVLSVRQLAQLSVWDLLGLTVPARRGAGQTLGGLLRACCATLTAGQAELLHTLARDDRAWTVAQAAAALPAPWETVIDDLGVLVGRGLVCSLPDETLRVPHLVRAVVHPAA
ncbi:helix-turn-helix domain-containing protein [Actinoplanes sp. NPDC051859]|uniref:helix-turn-helix domain-containing protein n=1 Tax=Actinoplanes sp. NPDC051859 TaxID=3363909 RepID=UPI0037A8FBED